MSKNREILLQEIERVEGLLSDGCSLGPKPFFEVMLWYMVDDLVEEARQIANVDITHPLFISETAYRAYKQRRQELITELKFYK